MQVFFCGKQSNFKFLQRAGVTIGSRVLDLGADPGDAATAASATRVALQPDFARAHAAMGFVLSVRSAIDGLVQHDQDRVRLTTRLLRVSDGALIWTDSFNERLPACLRSKT